MALFGKLFGRLFGRLFGDVGEGGGPGLGESTAFEDYDATVELDGYLAELELDDYTATIQWEDPMGYCIKAGNLAPAIAGRIRAPKDIDLTGATLLLIFTGRKSGRHQVTAVLDGRVAGSETDWRWHYTWTAGDTDTADDYSLSLSATVGGRPMTFPNEGVGRFKIEPAP